MSVAVISRFPTPTNEEKMYNDQDFNPVNSKKKPEEFRNFGTGARQKRVQDFYELNHSLQTLDFVKSLHQRIQFQDMKMTIWESFDFLQKIVDESDPDTNFPQSFHAFQTAEAIRSEFPGEEYDWFHLTGLIHDLGKTLSAPCFDLPQWAIVGDTFPLGCQFSEDNVFPEYFSKNADFNHPVYSTPLGIYEQNCGLNNLYMSYGHDEYLYQVLKHNKQCTLPPQALFIIRFHSFYPWHKLGAYQHLATQNDQTEMLSWVLKFNKFDLYSKSADPPNIEELKPYYTKLIEKYLPGKLGW